MQAPATAAPAWLAALARISSRDNPRFRDWLRLAEDRRQQQAGALALAEGLHLAQAALDAAVPIRTWLLRDQCVAQASPAIAAQLLAVGTALHARASGYVLSPALYDRLSPVAHGVGLTIEVETRAAVLPEHWSQDLIYLDDVQDPGNVGTLLRTAAAAGVTRIVCSAATAWPWSPKALRAGMGAQFGLQISVDQPWHRLRAVPGARWLACDLRDAEPLWQIALPRSPLAWVLGAEGRGVSAAVLAACDARVSIPIEPGVESLNVAAAAAICLFERRRRIRESGVG